jgi:hypothetical protein
VRAPVTVATCSTYSTVAPTPHASGPRHIDAVPADLVMLCGIFGNINDSDVERTVSAAPSSAGRTRWCSGHATARGPT